MTDPRWTCKGEELVSLYLPIPVAELFCDFLESALAHRAAKYTPTIGDEDAATIHGLLREAIIRAKETTR